MCSCWMCDAEVKVEMIYFGEDFGYVASYECQRCGHTGEVDSE